MDYLSAIEEMANDLVKRHIITADSDDSLARATTHRVNDEVNGGAPAPEDQPQGLNFMLQLKHRLFYIVMYALFHNTL